MAHENRNIKIYDVRRSYQIHDFVAHGDAVTGLCFDSNSNQLFTCGHDGNIRVWDIRTYKCLNDVKANRKKYDESIYNIDLCKGKAIVSAGADSIIKLIGINQR